MARNGKTHDEAADRSAKLRERMELQVTTLRGDFRDAVLRLVKDLPEQWRKMTGAQQDTLIDRVEEMASNTVDQAVDLVAARGCEAQVVRVGKVTANNGTIKCEFTAPYSLEALSAIAQRQNQEVVLVARDVDQFKGERDRAESDNIGSLAIPRKAISSTVHPEKEAD